MSNDAIEPPDVVALANPFSQIRAHPSLCVRIKGVVSRSYPYTDRCSALTPSGVSSKMFGRDHHPDCFTMFLAGGGTKPGISHGVTDDLGYSVVQDPVTVRDLQATMLHQLGIDPHRFSYPSQGLNVRFIGPENKPRVVTEILT